MKVMQVIKPGVVEIAERPYYSEIGADEVVIKVKNAGVCGSDMHIYNGESAFATYPNIMGHEIAGEVWEFGANVTGLQKGDKVAVDNVLSCGKCYACREGRPNVCREVKCLGVHVDGGFLEYLKIKKENVYKLTDNIPWEYAAMVEPYSIALQVVDRGRLKKNDTVLICGAGPIGLVTLQVIKNNGNKVMIMDIVKSRLEKAKELGADVIIDCNTQDVREVVLANTDNEGASLIIEATGDIHVMEDCVAKYASSAARIVILGFPNEYMSIKPLDIMRRELEIIGTRLNNKRYPKVIEMLDKKLLDPSPIITHTFKYTDVKQAFDLKNANPGEVIKIVLSFDE